MSKAGHYQRLFNKSTINLSIDIVSYQLSMNRDKYIGQSIIVNLEFVTNKVGLLMKNLQWLCRSVVVGLKFEIDKVKISMKNISVIVGLSLSGTSLWLIKSNCQWQIHNLPIRWEEPRNELCAVISKPCPRRWPMLYTAPPPTPGFLPHKINKK